MAASDSRAGDADRERALRELVEHLGSGRLSLPEFEVRSAAVLAAESRVELAASFADLPAGVPPGPPGPAPRPGVRRAVLATALTCLALLLTALTGQWAWLLGLLAVPLLLRPVLARPG
ncbi:DUF1707 SHOCT-like domain-containing protein [Nocardia asteroides]|uniref:DUF1707 SHOCT-like domain-containing protein n=1 Tax=Nocardia asteroides TaxID=1824 RepID=UPI001E35B79A|nr:DUF1707 domain-containing protein [Nocardia asteroides]UGT63327.1 DUF1707 domain-containing protein [Nocardia asteroides]